MHWDICLKIVLDSVRTRCHRSPFIAALMVATLIELMFEHFVFEHFCSIDSPNSFSYVFLSMF